MEYEQYSNNAHHGAPPLPIKHYAPALPPYADVASLASSDHSDNDRSSKAGTEQSNLNTSPWLLRRTSIHVSSEAAEPFDNDKESTSRMSIATSKRSEKEGGLRKRLFKQSQPKHQGSVGDVSTTSSWEHTETSDSGFGTKVSIQAGQPGRTKAERHYDMKGLEQATNVKRWSGSGKPGEAWGKLQKVGVSSAYKMVLLALTLLGSRPVESKWRCAGIFRLPTTYTIFSSPLVAPGRHWIGNPDFHAA